ncbi:hypothetical protein EG68_02977 [Paragonimus skrjabini miyazakii]|uniref:Uncharacterized protein n=1 Tax=Paragonimus skrjabini miyazakii TaxID=59628 RepID=A0A8S9Z383_9TREM|nr:hypothetical protein EG68_02977 [Paragonimus skrjabini miyazakii]
MTRTTVCTSQPAVGSGPLAGSVQLQPKVRLDKSGITGPINVSHRRPRVVTCFRGSDLRVAREITTQQLGQPMVEITYLNDATIHRRHLSLIHFRTAPNNDAATATSGENRPIGSMIEALEERQLEPSTLVRRPIGQEAVGSRIPTLHVDVDPQRCLSSRGVDVHNCVELELM